MTPLSIRNDVVLAADRLVVVVRATNHGEHLAGVGVDDLGGTVVDVSRLEVGPVDVGVDGLLGDLLHVVVERRLDPKATARDHGFPILLAQLPEDIVDEPGGLQVFLDAPVLKRERLFDRLVVLELADVVVAEHVAQDEILATHCLGGGRRIVRVETRRRIRDTGKHGGLGDVEILRGLGEIGLGRGLDAIGLVPVEDLVEVKRQDLVLGEATLDLKRQRRLSDLAFQGVRAPHEHPLDELLGDRAGALLHALVGQVGDRRRDDAWEVDPLMGVELPVFERDGGVDQVRGDRGQRDHRADDAVGVLDVEQHAVTVVDVGRLREFLWVE